MKRFLSITKDQASWTLLYKEKVKVAENQVIVEVFTLVAVFILILASLKVGQEGSFWKAARLFILVAGVVSILSLFLYVDSTNWYDSEYTLRFGIEPYETWFSIIRAPLHNIIYIVGQILFINWAENPYENRVYTTVNGAGETVQYGIRDAYREMATSRR